MNYADARCTYTEEFKPEHVYVYRGRCAISGVPQEVRIKGAELYAYRQGALIQNAMPSLSADDREFLISGTSKGAWDKLFGPLDEVEEEDNPELEGAVIEEAENH